MRRGHTSIGREARPGERSGGGLRRLWLPGAALALLLLAGCAPGPRAPDDGAHVEVRVAPDTAAVGLPAEVTVRVTHPGDARVELPALSAPEVEVTSHGRAERRLRTGVGVTELTWRVLSFEVGEHALFEDAARLVHADGREEAVSLDEAVLVVRSALAGKEEVAPREPKPPLRWPGGVPRWLWVPPLIAAAAAVLGVLARSVWQRPRAAPPAPPPPPADAVALAALWELRARGWIEAGRIEPFYVELSGIVRRYLEDRFGLRAPEQTTEELISAATSSDLLSAERQTLVRDFLAHCDLVKFARHAPDPEAMHAAWAAAERLVRETAPAAEDAR